MFTGLIESVGEITRVTAGEAVVTFRITAPAYAGKLSHGESVASSGVCLTVTTMDGDAYEVEAMPQTLEVTTAGAWRAGTRVNLERALRADTRLGGHIVQGHVDNTAEVLRVVDHPQWRVLRFSLADDAAALVVDKGSVCVDGVSLTVSAVSDADVSDGWFEVSLIPETLAATTLGALVEGDRVNVETDVLARHVQRMLAVTEARA